MVQKVKKMTYSQVNEIFIVMFDEWQNVEQVYTSSCMNLAVMSYNMKSGPIKSEKEHYKEYKHDEQYRHAILMAFKS